MKCPKVEELTAAQEGLLSEARCAEIMSHTQTCARCAAHLAADRHLTDLLGGLQQLPPPPGSWQGVQARLTPRKSREPIWGNRAHVTPIVALTLLIVFATAALFLMPHLPGVPVQVASGPDVNSLMQAQISTAWDNPLADRAALGLASIAIPEKSPQEVID